MEIPIDGYCFHLFDQGEEGRSYPPPFSLMSISPLISMGLLDLSTSSLRAISLVTLGVAVAQPR